MLFHNRKRPFQGFPAKQKGCVVWYSLRARLRQWDREYVFSMHLQHLEGTASTWEDRLRSLNWLEWAWNKMITSYEHTICATYQLYKFDMENGRMRRLDSIRNMSAPWCLKNKWQTNNDSKTNFTLESIDICFTCRHWSISKSTEQAWALHFSKNTTTGWTKKNSDN